LDPCDVELAETLGERVCRAEAGTMDRAAARVAFSNEVAKPVTGVGATVLGVGLDVVVGRKRVGVVL